MLVNFASVFGGHPSRGTKIMITVGKSGNQVRKRFNDDISTPIQVCGSQQTCVFIALCLK